MLGSEILPDPGNFLQGQYEVCRPLTEPPQMVSRSLLFQATQLRLLVWERIILEGLWMLQLSLWGLHFNCISKGRKGRWETKSDFAADRNYPTEGREQVGRGWLERTAASPKDQREERLSGMVALWNERWRYIKNVVTSFRSNLTFI